MLPQQHFLGFGHLGEVFLITHLRPLLACDRDHQCGGGMCCAVSLWIRSLRMCTPMGNLGDECHPLSHRVPFSGRRMHHTCPCLPSLACVRTSPTKFKCLPDFRKEDVFF
uniref:Prokineticin 2 n=1 Tax=Amazona collaria TaxID=241587 RepID=A0A8B9GJL6_9PSIT